MISATIPRPRDYYSDLRKMKAHYPKWDITQSLEETIRQIVEAWKKRPKTQA
jgi:CDP-paratose 2-epimerase